MRRHGWQLPYHPLQVVAVAVFLALSFAFYVFFAPFVGGKRFQYAVMGLYTPLVACVFVLYIWCAAMDPADPGVFKSKKYLRFCNNTNHSIPKERKFDTVPSSLKNDVNGPVKAGEKAVDKIPDMDNTDNRSCSEVEDKPKFIHALSICMALSIWCPLALPRGLFCSHEQSSEPQTSEDGMFYCSLCKVEVFKYSKHCRVCDKCVDGFDHHCRWINNCIGRKNYRRFFTLMMSSLLLLIVQWSVGILVLICCFLERKRFAMEIITKLGSSFSLVPFVIVVASCTFLAILATLPLAQLFCFHVLLIKKGISTYDYIIALREQEQLATGDQQSAQMSPVSSLTGLSSVSSFNTYHRGAWCTPPRLFLEDQFDVVPPDAGISSSSKKLHYAEPSNKRSNGSLKINPWTLARLNTEEVSKATEQARKKSKILQPVGKRVNDKRGRFPIEPAAHLSSKASTDDLMVVCNDNDSVAEPSTSLAPLQLEARSAFRTSRAMSAVGMVASSPDSSLDSPDLHPYRRSSSGVEHFPGDGALAAADAQNGVNFSRSTSDGYEPSGGEDSDQIPPRTLHRASNWDGFVLGSGHLNSRAGSMNSHPNERLSKSRPSSSWEGFSRFVA